MRAEGEGWALGTGNGGRETDPLGGVGRSGRSSIYISGVELMVLGRYYPVALSGTRTPGWFCPGGPGGHGTWIRIYGGSISLCRWPEVVLPPVSPAGGLADPVVFPLAPWVDFPAQSGFDQGRIWSGGRVLLYRSRAAPGLRLFFRLVSLLLGGTWLMGTTEPMLMVRGLPPFSARSAGGCGERLR